MDKLSSLNRTEQSREEKRNAVATFSSKCICSVSPASLPVERPDVGEQHHDGQGLLLLVLQLAGNLEIVLRDVLVDVDRDVVRTLFASIDVRLLGPSLRVEVRAVCHKDNDPRLNLLVQESIVDSFILSRSQV